MSEDVTACKTTFKQTGDLDTIVAGERVITIRHPSTNEPLGLMIRLRPQSSPEVKAVSRRLLDEGLKTRGKGMTALKVEANVLDKLVAATAELFWEGETNWRGQKLDSTPANVRKLYKEAPWIREQVEDELGDEAAFFRGGDSLLA